MGHRFFIGTSGWNYPHWEGRFYPEGMATSEWLGYYAGHFDTVEINNSFYRWPERKTFERWRSESPEGFTFSVKASQYLTHRKKLKDPEEPLERTFSNVVGLGEKLGPILYQLPPRWKVDTQRLGEFLPLLAKGIRHVMEFRDPSWQIEEVFDLLREYSVGYCVMVAPGLECIPRMTADFAYIRMHYGEQSEGGNFTEEWLREWADQVGEFLESGDVYVYFNNDQEAFAVRNASRLGEILEHRRHRGNR